MAKMKSDGRLTLWSAVLASLLFAGCSDSGLLDLANERGDRQYRSAMADYQAGRLDAAIVGFEKAARADPANASVRFQLACLLHDYKKDYLGAYCAYREYLVQHPESEKAAIVQTRLSACEKELAAALASKYKLDGAENLKVIETLRKDLKESERRLAAAEKDLQTVRERHASLSEERDRLVAAVKGTGELAPGESTVPVSEVTVKEARALLEEDDEQHEVDRIAMSKDIAELKADEKEESQNASSLLPAQPADAKIRNEQAKNDRERQQREMEARERQRHPAEYIVQEGDTLYRLAERFYGRISAWKMIRDANKAVISTDGRLKTGTRITLPYGVK